MAENNIARNIRVIRAQKGWNQSELADRAGVDLRTIQAVETEGRNLRAVNLINIAKALNVSVSEIVGEENIGIERSALLVRLLKAVAGFDDNELRLAASLILSPDFSQIAALGTDKAQSAISKVLADNRHKK